MVPLNSENFFASDGVSISEAQNFGSCWSSIGVSLSVQVDYLNGTSTTSPLIIHAICVQSDDLCRLLSKAEVGPTDYPPPKRQKFHYFDPPTCIKSEISDDSIN